MTQQTPGGLFDVVEAGAPTPAPRDEQPPIPSPNGPGERSGRVPKMLEVWTLARPITPLPAGSSVRIVAAAPDWWRARSLLTGATVTARRADLIDRPSPDQV